MRQVKQGEDRGKTEKEVERRRSAITLQPPLLVLTLDEANYSLLLYDPCTGLVRIKGAPVVAQLFASRIIRFLPLSLTSLKLPH